MSNTIDCWADLEHYRDYEKPILLYGPPGTGKTTFGASVAQQGQTALQITLTEDSSNTDIWGYQCPDGKGGVRWYSGPGLIAWREGLPIVVNEVNRAGDSALTALYALLDDPGIAQTTLTDGTFVQPKSGLGRRQLQISNATCFGICSPLHTRSMREPVGGPASSSPFER